MTGRAKSETLRKYLRRATRQQHELLDAGAGVPDFTDPASHAAFLQRQFAARRPIELWAAEHCPVDIAPPPTSPLLRADLRAIGAAPLADLAHFKLPNDADALGLAWALAGSHLGNRMMLKTLVETAPNAPRAFFADEAMTAFWRSLRPRLERAVSPESAERATRGAQAAFDRFFRAFGLTEAGRFAA